MNKHFLEELQGLEKRLNGLENLLFLLVIWIWGSVSI